MYQTNIFHALGLHMHQPPGNLALLLDADETEAQQILHCYDRATRFAHKYINIAHFHIAFSGTLIEQLRDPKIVDRCRHLLDIPAMLESYRVAKNIELIGTGYQHPVFPLMPKRDWASHLMRERELMEKVFGRAPKGFFPPEMAFSMEMIPALVQAGYEYVIIDVGSIHPHDNQPLDAFRPYFACHDDQCIMVVPIDRDVSRAQETGLDPVWFANDVRHRAWHSPAPDAPRLITTWTNGENEDWFRNEEAGFFGHFVAPYMEHAEYGEYPITPISISEYLKQHRPEVYAYVESGSWKPGLSSGYGLSDWGGSEPQRHAVEKIHEISQRYDALQSQKMTPTSHDKLQQVHDLLLESQSSCFVFWGEDWIARLYERTNPAEKLLNEIEHAEKPKTEATPSTEKQSEKAAPAKVEEAKEAVQNVARDIEIAQPKEVAKKPAIKGYKPLGKETPKPEPQTVASEKSEPVSQDNTKQVETVAEKTTTKAKAATTSEKTSVSDKAQAASTTTKTATTDKTTVSTESTSGDTAPKSTAQTTTSKAIPKQTTKRTTSSHHKKTTTTKSRKTK